MAKIDDKIRSDFMARVRAFLEAEGEEVLTVKSNTFSIPWAEGDEEGYINLAFSIPKGQRGGDGYNGHEEAQNFEFEQGNKAAEKAEKEAAKKRKMERDAAAREAKKKAKKAEGE